MGLLADVQTVTPGARLNLYIIDFTTTGLVNPPVNMYLYSGVAENYGNLVFNGNAYTPFPMTIAGLKQAADGPLPRPVITVSNVGGFMSKQMLLYNDFIGAKVTRYQTFAKYLDGEPEADPNARNTEIYFIEQKKGETSAIIELVMVTAVDAMDSKLPARIMLTNTCMWRYKSEQCSWPGTDSALYFDANDQPVVNQGDDTCGKRLTSCKYRFGGFDGVNFVDPNAKLTFGAFPALGRSK